MSYLNKKPVITYDQAYEHFFLFLPDDKISEALDDMQHNEKICNQISSAISSEDDCNLGQVMRSAIRDYFKNEADEYAVNQVNESKYTW